MIWTVLGTIGIVAITIALGILADRRWGLIPRKERLAPAVRPALPAHAAGQAPATAIRAAAAQIENLRATQRCCRTVMEALPDDEVAFDGKTLAILRFRCAACAATRSVYVQRLVE